jgi:hypothetical protein
MKITVKQVGYPKYPRYVLALENGCYYDGTGWTPDLRKAIRYASLPVIKQDWKRLGKEINEGKTVLEAKIRITVDKPLTREQIEALAWFMSEASGFTLDYSRPRPVGLADANISSQLVWSSLRRREA